MKENSYDAAIERRNKQTKDIFEKAAQEGHLNHTMVGSSGSFTSYEPHNHRLYFSYKKPQPNQPQPTSQGRFIYLGSKNWGSEHQYEDNITHSKIIIKKTQVEVRHKARKYFLIDNAHPEEIDKIKEIQSGEAISIFREFVTIYGGIADFTPLKDKVYDNTIKDNSLTKQIPTKAWWEDEVSKKVYEEPNKVEAKSEQYAKNLIHNAGLEDFNPKMEARLKGIETRFNEHLEKLDRVLVPLTEQIQVHLEVENRTNELLKTFLDRQGRGEGRTLFSPQTIQKASSKPTPPNALKYNIRDSFPEGWFE